MLILNEFLVCAGLACVVGTSVKGWVKGTDRASYLAGRPFLASTCVGSFVYECYLSYYLICSCCIWMLYYCIFICQFFMYDDITRVSLRKMMLGKLFCETVTR